MNNLTKTKTIAFSIAIVLLLNSCKKDCPESPGGGGNPGTTSNVKLNDGLVAYYPFNGNTNDESGNGLNGILFSGATLSHDQNGKDQSALNLNGGGQAMRVTNTGFKINMDTAMTLSFQVMVRTLNRAAWLGTVDVANGQGQTFSIGPALDPTLNLHYSIVNNAVPCGSVQTSAQVTNVSPSLVPKNESWYHILATFRKGVMKFYINGALAGTTTRTDSTMRFCPAAQLVVGGWTNYDTNASLNGKMDEVRIYRRELNADEIAELSKKFR